MEFNRHFKLKFKDRLNFDGHNFGVVCNFFDLFFRHLFRLVEADVEERLSVNGMLLQQDIA